MADHVYGCHNRPDYVTSYPVSGGHFEIKTTAERDCQYTKSDLGKVDKACSGCNRKRDTQ